MHYAVSDVHGHIEDLVAALRRAGLLDADLAWSGSQARLSFLGDYVDRGPHGMAVIDLVRRLQAEAGAAGGRVDALIGNHEILALGMHRFGARHVPSDSWSRRSFARSWALNGGQLHDQQGLHDEQISWLSALDTVLLAGPDLLLHSDTTEYLRWGHTTEQINDAVRTVLAGDDLEAWWQCWARLTARYGFAGREGERVAGELLDLLGGQRIVHGHSVVTTFTGASPREVTGPLSYAGGLVLAIDGGVYGGGPCLVVRLDPEPAPDGSSDLGRPT
jgi:Calcineurin-like phosphoesterase